MVLGLLTGTDMITVNDNERDFGKREQVASGEIIPKAVALHQDDFIP